MKSTFGGQGGRGGKRFGGRPDQDQNRINERIRVPEVRLIDNEGEQLGIVKTQEALELARSRGLDLVEVAATSKPPVCKILDYGKLKYTKKKKEQEAKKKQATITVKEIQLRPRTEEHDFEVKFKRIENFLQRGDKVKISVIFRGREMAYTQQGHDMLNRIVEETKEYAIPENKPKLEGRRMIMVMAPAKAKPGAAKKPASK